MRFKKTSFDIHAFLKGMQGSFSNKTFRSIALSYFALSFLMIAINLPVTYISTNAITKKNDELNSYILYENANELNKTTVALKAVPTSIIYNNELSVLLPRGAAISNIDYYNAKEISSIINISCKSAGQPNLHFAIYIKDFSTFITESGVLSETYFFHSVLGMDDTYKKAFIESILTKNQKYFSCGNYLAYSCNRIDNANIYAFSYISLNEIMPRIESFHEKTHHNLAMVAPDSSLVIAEKDFCESVDLSTYIQKPDDTTHISVSMPNNWQYYMIFDNHTLQSSLTRMWVLVILNLLFELILSMVLAITFSKKSYTPIQEIKQLLTKDQDFDVANDDYSYIKQGITGIVKENLLSTKKLYTIKTMDDLRNLVCGRCDETTYASLQDLFDLPLTCVAIVAPDVESINVIKAPGISTKDIDTIFTNIFEELISGHYKACVFSIYDKYCCIINGETITNTVLESALQDAASSIEHYFGIKTYIAVSSCTCDLSELHLCYNNAIDILSLMQTLETKRIMFGTDFENIKSLKYDNSVAKKISHHINANQHDKAYQIFEAEVNNLMNHVQTKMMLEQTVYSVISMLDYVLNHLSVEESPAFLERNNPFVQLLPFESISTLMQNAKKYLSTLALIVQQENKNDLDSIELQIKKFIDDNYTNCELSATLISDRFEIKPSSLSQLFKKAFNIGMSEYITDLRIQKAKELLTNSEMSLDEIAESVGYSNARSFFRAFKRIEGVSPRKTNS